jgi:hypothetical protein
MSKAKLEAEIQLYLTLVEAEVGTFLKRVRTPCKETREKHLVAQYELENIKRRMKMGDEN